MYVNRTIPPGVQHLYKLANEQPSVGFTASYTNVKEFKTDVTLRQPQNEFVKVVPPSL